MRSAGFGHQRLDGRALAAARRPSSTCSSVGSASSGRPNIVARPRVLHGPGRGRRRGRAAMVAQAHAAGRLGDRACWSSGPHCLSIRASRLASDESSRRSVPPAATCSSSALKRHASGFAPAAGCRRACVSVTPTQSTMTKCVLAVGVGRDGLQLVRVDDAHAAALHLLEAARATCTAAHEHHDLDRLDVGAGGDHVHGDGDARVVAVAEVPGSGPRASRRSTL